MARPWTDWYWPTWLLLAIGLAFGVPEFLSLTDTDPNTAPLTNWTVGKGLGEAAVTAGLWLAFHFGIRVYRRMSGK